MYELSHSQVHLLGFWVACAAHREDEVAGPTAPAAAQERAATIQDQSSGPGPSRLPGRLTPSLWPKSEGPACLLRSTKIKKPLIRVLKCSKGPTAS